MVVKVCYGTTCKMNRRLEVTRTSVWVVAGAATDFCIAQRGEGAVVAARVLGRSREDLGVKLSSTRPDLETFGGRNRDATLGCSDMIAIIAEMLVPRCARASPFRSVQVDAVGILFLLSTVQQLLHFPDNCFTEECDSREEH